MPYKFTRISKAKKDQLLRCFAADLTATQSAFMTGLNRNTINEWYMTLRRRIAAYRKENSALGAKTKNAEAFLAFQSARFSKFNGLPSKNLPLHVEESKFRYENKGKVLKVLTQITGRGF